MEGSVALYMYMDNNNNIIIVAVSTLLVYM